MKVDKKELMRWANAQRADFEAALKELVETPSVSSDPDRTGDIRNAADLAANGCRKCLQVLPAGAHKNCGLKRAQ